MIDAMGGLGTQTNVKVHVRTAAEEVEQDRVESQKQAIDNAKEKIASAAAGAGDSSEISGGPAPCRRPTAGSR